MQLRATLSRRVLFAFSQTDGLNSRQRSHASVVRQAKLGSKERSHPCSETRNSMMLPSGCKSRPRSPSPALGSECCVRRRRRRPRSVHSERVGRENEPRKRASWWRRALNWKRRRSFLGRNGESQKGPRGRRTRHACTGVAQELGRSAFFPVNSTASAQRRSEPGPPTSAALEVGANLAAHKGIG